MTGHGYGLGMLPQHAELLAASAISPDVAQARGYRSVTEKSTLESAGFARPQRIVPGLLIPVHGSDGQVKVYQYRPDEPRLDGKGKPRKYETPFRAQLALDVPPPCLDRLADSGVPLFITEGVRKADAAATAGLCCVGLLGVDGWTRDGVALPDWRDVALKDRRVFVCFDSDVMTKDSVRGALNRLTGWLGHRGATVAHIYLPAGQDGAKVGLDDYLAAGHTVVELAALARDPAEASEHGRAQTDADVADLPPAEKDGAALLDDVAEFFRMFVAFSDEHALTASVLWAAHAHGVDYFESTPRIGYLAPEKACGKTRALEVMGLLVPRPMHAVNATPAALFRSVAGKPTILYDEIDTVFGPRAKENEEVRGLLNAGHRRSGVAYRCVGEGAKQEVVAFPAYAPVAFAGIGDLPDTIMSRTVVIRMRRRAPHETVTPFRARIHEPVGHLLRDRLAAWMGAQDSLSDAWPDMPEGVTDRDADVWEPLLAVADAAGGHWPQTARAACVALVVAAAGSGESLGVRLLRDLRQVFGDSDVMSTETILSGLRQLEESPWSDLRGKPIDSRGLANRLRQYGVRSKGVRIGDSTLRGYTRADLWDPWTRYLPVPPSDKSATSATSATAQVSEPPPVADVADDAPAVADERNTVTCKVAPVADVADLSEGKRAGPGICRVCGQPLMDWQAAEGWDTHSYCTREAA